MHKRRIKRNPGALMILANPKKGSKFNPAMQEGKRVSTLLVRGLGARVGDAMPKRYDKWFMRKEHGMEKAIEYGKSLPGKTINGDRIQISYLFDYGDPGVNALRKQWNVGGEMPLTNRRGKKGERNPVEYTCFDCGWTGDEDELHRGESCPECHSRNVAVAAFTNSRKKCSRNPGKRLSFRKKFIMAIRKDIPQATPSDIEKAWLDVEKEIKQRPVKKNPKISRMGKTDWSKYKGRPPKEWFSYVVREIKKKKPDVKDPQALAGWLWFHQMDPKTREKVLIAVKAGRASGIIRKLSAGMVAKGKMVKIAANKSKRRKLNPSRRSCSVLPNKINGMPSGLPPAVSRDLATAIKLYRKRHGVNPVSIVKVKVPPGYPRVGVPMGNVPEIMYKTPKHINPKAKVPNRMYRHKFEGKTVLVTNPKGKGLFLVPKKPITYKRWITG